ncbi:histone-lysine N-methyltransferase PRDM9-like isoform X2 [Zootermopsis nevadensis]|uniref:histone-lysine N-methyltransferase PRDM9-like isoform X2 n=1 Tax=Zootermopsis nevadensis TaxID=136037 RepID=UPI000B8E662B|nr:histone-lysine N-methyltransferase PRDM9-like isoform X2 [Zootermopsis nevadensis]
MMDAARTSQTLIEDAIAMVHAMDAEEKLKAVQYWNIVSERLQDIVNHSVEDISALTFQMEGEKLPDYIDASQLVSLGMAPTFMTRYISDSDGATSPSGRRGRTFRHVNGHLIVTDSMTNLDMLQSSVGLEVEAGINAQHVTLEGVDMGAEETVDECANRTDQETNSGHETESSAANSSTPEMQVEEMTEESVGDGNTVHLMITTNSQSSPTKEPALQSTVQRKGRRGKKKEGENERETDADDASYECEYCQRAFNTPSQLTTHSWTHTKPYSCTDCQARFSTKGNLIVHSRRHSGERPYSCPSCDASFSTKGNLKRHVKSHSGEKPWQCTQCGSRFTEKKSLKVHMRRHTGERPYQCSVCLKAFSQTSILQSHMAMHLNQRAHLCNQCGKSFRQKSQLRLHEQRHAGLRKYECTLCQFKFLTKGDMERHKRVHTGERPFVCDECGKTFTRQQSLNEHMNRHWGLKPYQCKYCRKGFVEMSACYKHIKTHERSKSDSENAKPDASTDLQGSGNGISPTTTDSGKFTLLLQGANPDPEVEQEHLSNREEQPPANSGITTVVIQRLPKNAMTLYNSKNSSDIQHLSDGKIELLKTRNCVEPVTEVISQHHDIQNIDFTAMNLLASASTFQQGSL